MGRVIKCRWEGVETGSGNVDFPLLDRDLGDDLSVSIFLASDKDVMVYAYSEKGDKSRLYPLYTGKNLDQTYTFEADIQSIAVRADTKTNWALRVLQTGVRTREKVDPIPHTVPLPLDQSPEHRMFRMIDSYLEAKGFGVPQKGHDYYKGENDADEDTDFGPGYSIDYELEQEIEEAIQDVQSGRKSLRDILGMRSSKPDGQQQSGRNDNQPPEKQPTEQRKPSVGNQPPGDSNNPPKS